MPPKENSCLGCSKKFTTKEYSIQCTVCGLWSHQKCGNVSDELLELIDKQKKATGITYWACRPCATYAQGMNHRLREIEVKKTTGENSESIKRLEATVGELQNTVRNNEGMTREEFENHKWEEKQEAKEVKARELNVVIQGVAENMEKEATGHDRWDWDVKACENIFRGLKLGLTAESLTFCRRVGERGRGPRPVIVGLHNFRDRAAVLRADTRNTEYEEVTFGPDLTKKQREEDVEMWNEMERRNKQLSHDDQTKNLVWRLVGPKGARRLVKGVRREGQEERPGRRGGAGSTGLRGRGSTAARGTATARGLRGPRGRLPQSVVRRTTGWLPRGGASATPTGIPADNQEENEVEEVFMEQGTSQNLEMDSQRLRLSSKRKERDGGSGEELEEESMEPPPKH